MAALVNSNTADFADKTIRLGADISLLRYEETGKPWWDGIGNLSKASGGAVGYQFWKKGTENLVAATEYVTLDALLQSAGASFREEMYVTAVDATGFSAQLSYVDYTSCRYYVTADGDKIDAPAALALTWAYGTGKLEEVAAKAENSGSIRFCYGISADQYGSAAGKRLVSGATSVTLTACAHTGKTAQVPEVPATCTETGLTAIDWSQSVSDIDKQHYEKYGLKQEEMDYIESTIKPME